MDKYSPSIISSSKLYFKWPIKLFNWNSSNKFLWFFTAVDYSSWLSTLPISVFSLISLFFWSTTMVTLHISLLLTISFWMAKCKTKMLSLRILFVSFLTVLQQLFSWSFPHTVYSEFVTIHPTRVGFCLCQMMLFWERYPPTIAGCIVANSEWTLCGKIIKTIVAKQSRMN